MTLNSLKPAVSRPWLIAIAGFTWTAVGVMLCRLAYIWLAVTNRGMATTLGLFGIGMSVAAYYLGFSKIARKNIKRLCLLTERTCVFAFQTWKGYLIIGCMVTLGIILRHSAIPKQYLAVIYTTIGGAIFLSSFHYYGLLWEIVHQENPCQKQSRTSENQRFWYSFVTSNLPSFPTARWVTEKCPASPVLQDGVKGHNMMKPPCRKALPFRAGSFTFTLGGLVISCIRSSQPSESPLLRSSLQPPFTNFPLEKKLGLISVRFGS